MKFSDLSLGLIFVVLGIAIVIHVAGFPEMGGMEYGPAFFPRLIGIAFVLTGGTMAVTGIAARHRDKLVGLPTWIGDPVALFRVGSVIAAIIAFVLLSPLLGFLLTTALLTLGLLLVMGTRILIAVPIAVVLPIALHFGFAFALRVPLPRGILEQALENIIRQAI